MIGVILAAGKGTRIKDVMCTKSKCLIPVNGIPILFSTLKNVSRYKEITKLIITINSQEKDIPKYVGNQYNGIEIIYTVQEKLEGIISAISYTMPIINRLKEDVMLLLGDEYFDDPNYHLMTDYFYKNDDDILVGVIHTSDEKIIKNNYSVELNETGDIIDLVEKPKIIINDIAGTGTIIFKYEILKNYYSSIDEKELKNKDMIDLILVTNSMNKKIECWSLEGNYGNVNSKDHLLGLYKNRGYYPENETIVSLLKKQVEKSKDKIAIEDCNKYITYEELEIYSDRVCNNLKNKINKENAVIPILLDRSIEYIVAMIGVLKAGFTYLPLDTVYPFERIEKIVKIAQGEVIITNEYIEYYQENMKKCLLYDDLICDKSVKKYEISINPDTEAYVMFTSGSTGEPKGCKITHKNIINNAYGLKNVICEFTKDRQIVGVVASLIFDMSVQQIYPSLLFGHTLKIMPHEFKLKGEKMLEFLNSVDICDATPALISMLLSYIELHHNNVPRLSLKHLIIGGEELGRKLLERYFEINCDGNVTNIYGPTECTVEATTFFINKEKLYLSNDDIYIGKPMQNIRIYILDENRKMLSSDEVGEIYIAGDCVGNGYINNQKLTSENFIEDILENNRYMYKTGDLGKWGYDGNIEFLGRKDNQVKVNGFRIELREIEIEIEKMQEVVAAKVCVEEMFKYGNRIKKIVAYIQSNNLKISIEKIKENLKRKLPYYMLPSYYVPVDKFQITNSGKIDSNFKKYEEAILFKEIQDSEVVHMGSKEYNIYTLIKEVLEIKTLDENDTFISSGGDSFSLFYLISLIESRYKINIDHTDISTEMKIFELISSIVQEIDTKKVEDVVTANKNISVRCTDMQGYMLKIDEEIRKDNNGSNRMLFFIKLQNDINLEKLSKVISRVIQNNIVFKMKFRGNHSKSKVFINENIENINIRVENVNSFEYSSLIKYFNSVDIRGNLLIETIIFTNNRENILGLQVHHAIFDFLSVHFFMKQVEDGYLDKSSLLEIKPQYLQYLTDMNKYKFTEYYTKDKEFWNNYYSEYTTPKIETKKLKHLALDMEKEKKIYLDSIRVKKIKEFCRNNNIAEYKFFFASFLITLSHLCVNEVISVLTFMTGRYTKNYSNALGYFSKLIYYNYRVRDEEFSDIVKRLSDQLDMLYLHERGFDISEYNKFLKDGTIELNPQDILFDYQKKYNSGKNKLWLKIDEYCEEKIYNGLVFKLYDYDEYIEIEVKYNSNLFDEKQINILINDFISVFEYNLNGKVVN